MKKATPMCALTLVTLSFAASGQSQTNSSSQPQGKSVPARRGRSAGGEIASGTGGIGKGAGKGAVSLAKGAAGGAVDLATLHPLDAAGAIGKGGFVAGKDIGVGAVKGTGKIVKGTGKAIRKVL